MKDSVTVTFPSHPKYLSAIRSLAEKMCLICGMTDTEAEDVKLAVDEACSNVIKHAYKGDTANKIVVKFRTGRKGFEVVIEDSGLKADPAFIRGRDLDDVRPGGLGIHLIKRAFDVFEFDELRKKGNRLRLIRHLKDSRENEMTAQEL